MPDNMPAAFSNATCGRTINSDDGRRSHDIAFERTFLLAIGWPPERVRRLEEQARTAGVGLLQTAISLGLLNASHLYSRLATNLSFGVGSSGLRVRLPRERREAWHLIEQRVPLKLEGEAGIALNGQVFSLTTLLALARGLGPRGAHLKLLTRQQFIDALGRSFGPALVERAVSGLPRSRPQWSAKMGLALWQALFNAIACGLFFGAIAVATGDALALCSLCLSVFFLLTLFLRAFAVLNILFPGPPKVSPPPLADADLPRYTVLVPLYREVAILPHLARALARLDYPAAKLDIKLVLESEDLPTIEAALNLKLPGNVDLIVVPDREPRTKPKALNYALQFATGNLAVIFDAEDRPEPDQLRKAATIFRTAPPDLACLQARLDYFNAKENWLSRQFTIEYATLFRGILPLFGRFSLPLPLGGTSNHFRIEALREVGAWDPYNVTEDADLGVRLRRAGYRAETLDSTTYEEACCQTVPWIKQRTRWLKGWMQTFGVHTRSPGRTLREIGLPGFVALQAYFAGIVISALVHPLIYPLIAFEAWQGVLFEGGDACDRLLIGLALVNFVGGYTVNILLGVLSLRGTRHKGLSASALLIPVYWLFLSAAAYRAVWQLISNPFYWEKTTHGISRALRPS